MNLRNRYLTALCALAFGVGLGWGLGEGKTERTIETAASPVVEQGVPVPAAPRETTLLYRAQCQARVRGYMAFHRAIPQAANPYGGELFYIETEDGGRTDASALLRRAWHSGWMEAHRIKNEIRRGDEEL